ncbi:hypothetical protein QE410_000880 [Microbacterium sp. SORGH_AS 1204]|uniref:hypothetical protein n=1 Tax=Microbacterium sp. SORGH_AS_1204 TaxID=3041785 RepID=UPI00279404C8|nr:hypothetical protein [Microbacterium sp. SORGH_AS_1204]MDQ1136081.1 hypothetical protein [Microbacterium sp. SORGH_AS_1204]
MNAFDRPTSRLGVVAVAGALALVSVLLIWGIAVPSGPLVCPAVYPAPTNCRAEFRVGTGLVASIVIAAAFVLTVCVALRRSAWRGAATCGVLVLVVAPFLAYALVTGLPGFAVG